MAIKSLFDGGVSSKLWLDRRVFYPEPQKVAELWTDITPFTTVLGQLEVKTTDDPVYKLFEHESHFVKRQFTTTSAETIAANGTESNALAITSIVGLPSTVDSSYKGLKCEIWDSTGTTKKGVVIITTNSSTTEVKAKAVKASAITTASGDIFKVINKVRGEGSVAVDAYSDELSTVWNSTEFFSEACEITGDLFDAAKLRGYSNEFARLREEMFKDFKVGKEDSFLKSVSNLGTNFNGSDTFTEANLRTITDSNSVSGVVRTTYGYIPILEDYGITYTGTGTPNADTNIFKLADLSYNEFVDYTEILFDKRDSQEAMAFSGRGAMSIIAKKANDGDKKFGWLGKVQLGDNKWNTLGFSMRALETPHGVLYLTPTKSLRDQYNKTMVIPDLNNLGIMQFKADEYKNDVKKDNDYDGVKDVISGKQGLWLTNLKRHHMFQFI